MTIEELIREESKIVEFKKMHLPNSKIYMKTIEAYEEIIGLYRASLFTKTATTCFSW